MGMSPLWGRRKSIAGTRRPKAGIVFFLFVLAALAVIGGVNLRTGPTLFVAGEIATQDVMADQDLLLEDVESTVAKRKQVEELQPAVFDLDRIPLEQMQSRVQTVFSLASQKPADTTEAEQIRWQIAEALTAEIPQKTIDDWTSPAFQHTILENVLPWLVARLNMGVVADATTLQQYRSGIVLRDLASGTETMRMDMQGVTDEKTLRDELAEMLKSGLKLPLRERRAATELLTPLTFATLTPNRETSRQRKLLARESVTPVYYHIKQGEIIVRQGERVSEEDQRQLQALINHKRQHVFPMRIAGIFLVSLLLCGGLAFAKPGRRLSEIKNKDLFFTSLLILIFAGGCKLLMLFAHSPITDPLTGPAGAARLELLPLLYPVPGAVGLAAMVFGFRRCSVIALILTFLCCAMTGAGLWYFLFTFITSMWYVLLVKRAQTRTDIALSVFPHMAGLLAAWLGIALFARFEVMQMGMGALYAVGNGLLSLLVLFALSPLIEIIFNYTTRFRLMELMNLEQPVLQELMLEAPGTYHHSLIVANMVEAGAKAIGANSLLCKVAALYHDMGKLAKPEYFIENQGRAKNPHDKLGPSMSTLIIISHVKRGVEMARQYRLGDEIADIIMQHHGTSLVRFFFNKAKEGSDTPREEDYSYPGPKPQTREAAVVMLADVVEASSRVLADPTPSRLRGHIDTIIKGIFAEGQLDESELTLRDLHTLSENFHRILTGIFHRRIEYPEERRDKANGTTGSRKADPRANDKPDAKGQTEAKPMGFPSAAEVTNTADMADAQRAFAETRTTPLVAQLTLQSAISAEKSAPVPMSGPTAGTLQGTSPDSSPGDTKS